MRGEGGAGLVEDTGGEDGVNGILPTDKTQLKHLGGKFPGPEAHCLPFGG